MTPSLSYDRGSNGTDPFEQLVEIIQSSGFLQSLVLRNIFEKPNGHRTYSNGVRNRNKIFVAKLIILTYLLRLNLSNDYFSTTIYLLPVQCDIGTIKLIFFDDNPLP